MSKRAEVLIDAALDVVSQVGITEFTIKKVTQRVGVSEALTYKYFESKEELLWRCFLQVVDRIEAAVDRLPLPENETRVAYYALARRMWEQYFCFLARHPRDTRFFSEFVGSPCFEERMDENRFLQEGFLTNLREAFLRSIHPYYLHKSFADEQIWLYILRMSEQFAGYAAQLEEEDTEIVCDMVWCLFSGGFEAIM